MCSLLSQPVILQAMESIDLVVQIQPFQIGYQEIILRVQNETNFFDCIDITLLTVWNDGGDDC